MRPTPPTAKWVSHCSVVSVCSTRVATSAPMSGGPVHLSAQERKRGGVKGECDQLEGAGAERRLRVRLEIAQIARIDPRPFGQLFDAQSEFGSAMSDAARQVAGEWPRGSFAGRVCHGFIVCARPSDRRAEGPESLCVQDPCLFTLCRIGSSRMGRQLLRNALEPAAPLS